MVSIVGTISNSPQSMRLLNLANRLAVERGCCSDAVMGNDEAGGGGL